MNRHVLYRAQVSEMPRPPVLLVFLLVLQLCADCGRL